MPSRNLAADGVEEARLLLQGAGLNLPAIPAKFAKRFKRRGKWCFSSRTVRGSPYLIDQYIEECVATGCKDYVLLAHAGHGVNSYALHYYLVQPPLSLFLQLEWGGIYMDNAETTAAANENFGLAGKLVDAASKAARQGHLQPQDNLLVTASSFYGGVVLPCDGHNWPPGSIPKVMKKPQDLLRQALEWSHQRWSSIGDQMYF